MTRCDDAPESPRSPARHARGRHRTTPTADRARLLAVAETLAAAAPPGGTTGHYAVAHVAMGDVAAEAGVTRTALYRLWPSRQDFWDELVQHLLTGAAVSSEVVTPGPVSPRALDATQDVLIADPLPLLRAAVVGHPTSEGVEVLAGHRDATVQALDASVATYLAGHRAARDGLTTTDLAVAVTIVGNGLPITARLGGADSVHVTTGGRRHSLLRALTSAVVEQLTVEIGLDQAPTVPAPEAPPAATSSPDGAQGPDGAAGAGSSDAGGAGRRGHYLAIASELALRPAPGGLDLVLGHVGLDALARAAGVTRRTLTNVWPDRTAFRLDLFTHLLARERRWLLDALAPLPRPGTDPIATFLAVGDALQHAVEEARTGASSLAFAAHLDAPPLAERARRDHEPMVDAVARSLRRLLSATGRRPRHGVPLRSVAYALTTVADGANRLTRTRPQLVGDAIALHDGTHTLTGATVAAVLQHLSEPIDTSEPVVDLARLLA